jgi:hypothetical protein
LAKKRSWSEFTLAQKAGVALGGAVQLGLLAAALADMRRRPQQEIRGSKRARAAAAFVNFVGPLCYFLFGRRR